MISPEFLIQYATSKGVFYLYDCNNDGVIDTRDVDLIKASQMYRQTPELNRIKVRPIMGIEK